jgi:hypothetical protein
LLKQQFSKNKKTKETFFNPLGDFGLSSGGFFYLPKPTHYKQCSRNFGVQRKNLKEIATNAQIKGL